MTEAAPTPAPQAPKPNRVDTIVRAIGTAVLVYVFVIVLMTASAQTRVAERLSKLPSGADYSAGYVIWSAGKDGDPTIVALKKKIDQQRTDLAGIEEDRERANDSYYLLVAQMRNLLARMSKVAVCDVADRDIPIDQLPAAISDIELCARNPATPSALASTAGQFLQESKTQVREALSWRTAERKAKALQAAIGQTDAAIAVLQKDWVADKPIRDAFSELNVLGHSWMIGGGILIEFPPAMIQILLAFVSGLFGGLLLTLVLTVYPRSELREDTDPTRFNARIWLGGLISLCVFIVLGGGAAVMGTAKPFTDGETNFLAFCAVGILAGMFSDRVAHWLSERADEFFRKQRDAAAPDPAAPDPAVPDPAAGNADAKPVATPDP